MIRTYRGMNDNSANADEHASPNGAAAYPERAGHG